MMVTADGVLIYGIVQKYLFFFNLKKKKESFFFFCFFFRFEQSFQKST